MSGRIDLPRDTRGGGGAVMCGQRRVGLVRRRLGVGGPLRNSYGSGEETVRKADLTRRVGVDEGRDRPYVTFRVEETSGETTERSVVNRRKTDEMK